MAGVLEQVAVVAGNKATFAHLTPVERRAVALLSGASPERRKSALEDRAMELADIVRAEWPARSVKQKRRRGRQPGPRNPIGDSRYGLITPISLDEAVQIVLPAFEALRGRKIAATVRGKHGDEIPSSDWFEAVLVAVRVLCGAAHLQSVRRAVARANALKKRK